jgi:hypothetical protein
VDAPKVAAAPAAPQTDRTERAPSFDVARIEPSGEAVIAGRASPGASVELLRGAEVHDKTVADPSGDFVLVPKQLPPGSYNLTLRATQPNGKVSTSKDSVAVALRSGGDEKPVVALVAPDKPAVVLSKPATDVTAGVAIESVESESGGKLYVSGRSTPGANVRLYLNDSYIAAATASAEGRVAFVIQSGIRPGDYRVRLDQVDASGKVQKRAEVPFNAPATVAAPASPATPEPKTATAAPGPKAASAPPPATVPASPTAAAPKPATAAAEPRATPAPAAAAAAPAAPATVIASANSSPAPAPAAPSPAVQAPALVTPVPPAADKPVRNFPAPQPPASAERSPQPAPAESAPRVVAVVPPAAIQPAAPQPKPVTDSVTRTPSAPSTVPPTSEPVASQPPALAGVAPPPSPAPEKRADVVVVPSIDTTVVHRGDSLWRISRATYGHGIRYSVIYSANRSQIRDPDLIYPGQIFVLPKALP